MTNGGHPKPKKAGSPKKKAAKKVAPKSVAQWAEAATKAKKPASA